MIRARTGDAGRRPTRVLILLLPFAAAVALAACTTVPATAPAGTPAQNESTAPSDAPPGSGEPSASAPGSPAPTAGPGRTAAPGESGDPSGLPSAACSGSEANREFFRQAAASMAWPVYCAHLPDGWFLEAGTYRLADGGRLEVTYRGPGDARLAIAEGHVCGDSDVEACAPRDALIGSAPMGDGDGELGRLANGLVLDLERGARPSWRVTGLGLTEAAFRELCAAMVVVEG